MVTYTPEQPITHEIFDDVFDEFLTMFLTIFLTNSILLGGGKCLVTYTPEQPITHEIEVTFNGEQVPGSPYLCRVIDPSNTIREIPVQVKRSYKIFDLSTYYGNIGCGVVK